MSESKPKLTPWFDGTVKPIRPGVYLREIGIRPKDYAYWSGHQWHASRDRPDRALKVDYASGYQCEEAEIRWRGLTRPAT